MPAIRLKRGREKPVLHRHPWIFTGAVRETQGEPQPGDVVDVLDQNGAFLARGYYNPHSQIVVRLLTWNEEAIDAAFWRRRLETSIARRQGFAQDERTTAYRLVYAESDGLPGLIVDRYGGADGHWLVVQFLALGLEPWRRTIVGLLAELLAPRGIYERSDVEVRGQEGLGGVSGLLYGEEPPPLVEILEEGLRFGVDLRQGHKTGFYLDQRENRCFVADYCAGAEVLNVFAYTGGFGVYAAQKGARRVIHLDSSADVLRLAEENMARNPSPGTEAKYVAGDAFQVLRAYRDAGRRFDVVILDPPKFAYSQRQIPSATRGYKDINMLGMALLRPGGTLATFSCSGLVNEDLFQKVLFGASVDVGREVRILRRLSQGPDHPVLLTFPEGAYLKGFICRVE
ncbi:MAG: class I SAM-dependent rRNA methyltransferase [Chloroflexi bacterium]|nr:class I SAM-dependent rRNA methyltransferase [Chloroflexota bacterium]